MYPTREKELLAALHAMRVWKPYLIDRPFFVNTDHKTLESILSQTTCSQRLARWLNELSFFQPQFRWIPGDTNVIADALSRSPQLKDGDLASHVSLAALLDKLSNQQSVLSADDAYQYYVRQRPTVFDQCRRLYSMDQHFCPLLAHLRRSSSSQPAPVDLHPSLRANAAHFILEGDLLYFQPNSDTPRRLCVPEDPDLRNMILFECHDSAARGHPGTHKTLVVAQRKFYWLNMHKTVAKYVQTCELCQRIKAAQHKPQDCSILLRSPTSDGRTFPWTSCRISLALPPVALIRFS
jgi:hypothetical protein